MPEERSTDPKRLERLLQTRFSGLRVLAVHPLAGGVSAQVATIDVEDDGGGRRRLVVRRHPHGPTLRREYRLLRALHAAGIAVPRPHALVEGVSEGAGPILVMDHVAGGAPPGDPLERATLLADQLVEIHRLGPEVAPFVPPLPERAPPPHDTLDGTLSEGPIRTALVALEPARRPNPPALLHGDVWPGNLLWRGGRIGAIVDWEDAAIGDPLADVGNARLELLWAWGESAMLRFAERYLGATGLDPAGLPRWDLRAALRPAGKLGGWGLEPHDEARMRARHHDFVAAALVAAARM